MKLRKRLKMFSANCLLYIILIIFYYSSLCQTSTQVCNGPLGMTTGEIRDWQITSSSSLWDPDCHEKYSRLYQPNDRAWCARQKSDSEWLQIDLGISAKISGVLIQGRANKEEYVTSFMISYSTDAFRWQYIVDRYGNQKVFAGNTDSYSVRHNYFDEPIVARFIKFHTIQWYKHPSLRVDIIGCQECKQHLGLPPYGKISASTSWPYRRHASCQPEDGHLLSNKGWCSKKRYKQDQWLEFDLGHPSTVTSLITKGRGDITAQEQWVTKYKVSFSNDTRLWLYYKDKSHIDPKEFAANNDRDSERIHFLNEPFFARFVRLHPTEWHNHVAMRAAVLGCPHQGQCFPGYFRVNSEAQCVENMAYKKLTWTNDRDRQLSSASATDLKQRSGRATNGDPSLAVDGSEDSEWSKCATIDNYYVRKPVWMVDLGRITTVSGVMVRTWHGSNKVYRDYLYNLDRYSVYVDLRPRRYRFKNSDLCSYVTRANQALLTPRLHFQCQRPIRGRYVYIEADGSTHRWNKLFTAVLCEVFVYEQ
ncbi:unnamed protein product [Didymodactylos carnosus]|uniref:F5/8 type C domain-containing protein n=1 Tax=Didymodactylos carnosus TaxID=1234261 RepID=A0A813P4G7_9BILA|nr:unnamed protein product [Didymodactylos carnosus]CAF0744907.1 unnamed protein product [Didymodactylos carnosus]CAF3493712.1 unnamed protein product [Didymodactylos carnosus]CAF3523571.1 unnamed protein product [Didymodactylos carnosus]